MPIYEWQETKTLTKVEVLRNFSEMDVPPSDEEALAAGLTEVAGWVRLQTSGSFDIRGIPWL